MSTYPGEGPECTPDFEECLARGMVDDLSRCLARNIRCAYATPAGDNGIFCLHPKNRMDLPYGFLSKTSGKKT